MFNNINWKWIAIMLLVITAVLGVYLIFSRDKNGRYDNREELPLKSIISPAAKRMGAVPASDTSDLTTTSKIIKTANLAIVVESVKKAMQESQKIIKSLNGQVNYASIRRTQDDYFYGETTLRVPAKSFDQALASIEKLGRVTSKNISAQDVTEQYMDLETRLRNYKKQETALVNLFKRAGKVKDILDVERELARVRTEAERIEGRLRVLKDKITYSTIRITFSQIRQQVPESAVSFLDVIKEAFSGALTALAQMVSAILVLSVWIVVFGPIAVVAGLIIYLIKRRL